jgi:N6-L-threonylcarbamoyladenine synthase/protein kinase Bud32
MNHIIAEGAEAKIVKIDKNTLKKLRLPKTYRISEIDTKLRKFRNKREFKILTKLYEEKINVPKPIENIANKEEIAFIFEYIDGIVLKEVLTEKLLYKAFEEIMKMHKLDIIHGDLTTLNMLVKEGKIYLIDFGLSEFTHKIENKAVDLNLFFTCIKNEHPDFYFYKEKLLKKYSKLEFGEKIIQRLKKIEHRGRNK